jgi:hypothetical protein
VRTPGDHPFEMGSIRKFTRKQAEDLLAGRMAADQEGLRELAGFLRATKAVAYASPSAATEQRHLAAIAEAAALAEHGVDGRFAPPRRSNVMVATILRSKLFKATAGAVAAVLATGGLAAANTLPGPAQDAVAFVAGTVGIDLPHADDHGNDKVKDGMDHDGDGVADDNGNHYGQLKHTDDPTASPTPKPGKSVSDDVHSVQDDDSLEGRDKGDAVSDAASQNRQDDEKGHKGDDHGAPSSTGPGDKNDNGEDQRDDDHADQGQNDNHDSPNGQDDNHGSDDD